MTGSFNPIKPRRRRRRRRRREKNVATEYDRIQCENTLRQFLDRGDRQEANDGQAPSRPHTIVDAWAERQGGRGRGDNLS